MNSDADNFALMDMKHELCDVSPCLECQEEDTHRADDIDDAISVATQNTCARVINQICKLSQLWLATSA